MVELVDSAAIASLVHKLKAAGGPVSGAGIARATGVSRTALWKHVERLRQLGYEISASTGVGYRLVRTPDRPYPWEVREGLRTQRLGHVVHYFDSTETTQDDARRLAEAGAPEGTMVIAEEQRSPRGRLGRAYFTPPGGLWFSLILRPHRSPDQVIHLSLLAGVGVHQAIEEVTGLRPWIRWPNDLLVGDRKLVGIGVELASEQDVLHYVIVGIGVNVNISMRDFPADLRPIAISLRELLGRDVPRVPLLQRILERIEALYDRYLAVGPAPVLEAWRALPSLLGQRVTVEELQPIRPGIETGGRWEGTAIDLDDDGALLVRTDDGRLHPVVAGDVRIATPKGPQDARPLAGPPVS